MIRLKELRELNKVSQQKLADSLSVARSTVAMWETGNSQPDNETLLKIASYFNVTVDYLLGREDIKKSPPDDWEDSLTEEQGAFLNSRDRRDIALRITDLRDDLASQNELYLSGEILDEETRELLQAALENAVVISKIMAKQKYNPKKSK